MNANGDPRGRVDVIRWIEAIPFIETRGYVQRVLENSVVYDRLRGPSAAAADRRACLALSREGPAGLIGDAMADPSPRFITPQGLARIRARI